LIGRKTGGLVTVLVHFCLAASCGKKTSKFRCKNALGASANIAGRCQGVAVSPSKTTCSSFYFHKHFWLVPVLLAGTYERKQPGVESRLSVALI
jgi:hypothetical protein